MSMSSNSSEVWMFLVEWYDSMPQIRRRYQLKYFPESHSVEMVDVNTKKVFLRKSPLVSSFLSTSILITMDRTLRFRRMTSSWEEKYLFILVSWILSTMATVILDSSSNIKCSKLWSCSRSPLIVYGERLSQIWKLKI